MGGGKAIEYRLQAARFRECAARALEPLARQQFLIIASDYDFLARTDEKIERDKASLP